MKKLLAKMTAGVFLVLLAYMQSNAVCIKPTISVNPATSVAVCQGSVITVTGSYTGVTPYTMVFQFATGTAYAFATTVTGITTSGYTFLATVPNDGTPSVTLRIVVPQAGCTLINSQSPQLITNIDVNFSANALINAGIQCYNSSGFDLGITSDDGAGYTYSLYRSGSLISTLPNNAGIGVDFGYQSTPGTYSIIGLNTATGCVYTEGDGLPGDQTFTINPVPGVPTITYTWCGAGALNFTGHTTTTGVAYNWKDITSGATGTGQNYTVGSPVAGHVYNLSVTANNCTSTVTSTPTNTTIIPTITYTWCGAGGVLTLTGISSTAGVSYKWLDLTNITKSAITAVWAVPSAINGDVYNLSVTANNCLSTVTSIPANTTIIPSITYTWCGAGGALTLTGISTTSGVSYKWLDATNITKSATTQVWVVPSATTGDVYNLSVTANNCLSTVTSTPVNTTIVAPTITYTWCGAGGVLTLTGSTPTGGVSYKWLDVTNNTKSATTAVWAVPSAATGDIYNLSVTANNCLSTVTSTPVNTTIFAPTIVYTWCGAGGTLTLYGPVTNAGANYIWQDFTTGSIPQSNPASYLSPANGDQYNLTITASHCTITTSSVPTYRTPPSATIGTAGFSSTGFICFPASPSQVPAQNYLTAGSGGNNITVNISQNGVPNYYTYSVTTGTGTVLYNLPVTAVGNNIYGGTVSDAYCTANISTPLLTIVGNNTPSITVTQTANCPSCGPQYISYTVTGALNYQWYYPEDGIWGPYGVAIPYSTIAGQTFYYNIHQAEYWGVTGMNGVCFSSVTGVGVAYVPCATGCYDGGRISVDETIGSGILYPNPASGTLNINAPYENYSLSIYNVLGSEVLSKQVGTSAAIVDISAIPAGTYTVKIIGKEGQIHKKLEVIK